jgi:hypothetical protein
MASQAIDRLGDLSATDEEWQLRKRRSPEGAPARWGDADTALISIDASKSGAARSNFASGIARLVWVN